MIGKYKAIVFDIDGTMYYHLPVRIISLLSIVLAHLFRPLCLLRVLRIIKAFRSKQEYLREATLLSECLADRQIMMTASETGESVEFVRQSVKKWMMDRPLFLLRFFLRSGLIKLLKRAKDEGIELGAYSDYPGVEKLDSMDIAHFFSAIVCSYDNDVMAFKPNSRGFLLCARKLGLNPAEILFVGDREEVDGLGAEKVGMRVALVDTFAGLKRSRYKYPRFSSFGSLEKAIFDPNNS